MKILENFGILTFCFCLIWGFSDSLGGGVRQGFREKLSCSAQYLNHEHQAHDMRKDDHYTRLLEVLVLHHHSHIDLSVKTFRRSYIQSHSNGIQVQPWEVLYGVGVDGVEGNALFFSFVFLCFASLFFVFLCFPPLLALRRRR